MTAFSRSTRASGRVGGILAALTMLLGSTASAASGATRSEAEVSAAADRAMTERIVRTIQEPSIPDRDYVITDFGARPGADARPAITDAIRKASEDGGGRVVVPAGTWLSEGPVHLASRIDLHLSEGATLRFGADPSDYLPVVHTRWEGTELYGYSPLIYAKDVQDVAITGSGRLDGNAQSGFREWRNRQGSDQQRLRRMGFTGVPVEERVFGEGTYLRPSMVQFFGAERVLLSDYTIVNSPFWINHLVYTEQATVRNLTVESDFANNDGVDVDSSRYVLVEGNTFRTGDDSVVVKSGRDLDGRRIGRPSQYVVVRHNDMGGEDGMALGSEMSGGVSHVYFAHNVLREGVSAFRFKGNFDRGGTVEHIRVRDMRIESFEQLIWFQLNYPGELGGDFPPKYRDIVFSDITVEDVDTFLNIDGPAGTPAEDILLRNITVTGEVEQPLLLDNVDNLRFENVVLGGDRVDGGLTWD